MTAADEMKEQAVAIFAEHGLTPSRMLALLVEARAYVNYAAATAISVGSRNVAAETLLAKLGALP